MNQRQRVLETLLFGTPDRIPLEPGHGRKSTVETWMRQGFKGGNQTLEAYKAAGGKLELPPGGDAFNIDFLMRPQFEEKVIERKADSQIVQDWKGNVCEIGLEFNPEYLRTAIDFVTRRWIKCPVGSRADWEDMKRRYDANDMARFPQNPAERGAKLKGRGHYVALHVHGPFWQLREWLGFETLCTMFYDDPAFVREMISFWEAFVSETLSKAFGHFVPDEVHVSEDMAYKSFSMVSPAMAREFLLPTWAAWGRLVKRAGVPIYAMDSDGFIGELIPLWIEAGINACDPVEVAAGNDIVAFRRQFGRRMAFRGGVDKREMAKGGEHIRREIERIMPVIKSGGFIPGCDHGVPPDVSWPDFVGYVGLLSKATGWA